MSSDKTHKWKNLKPNIFFKGRSYAVAHTVLNPASYKHYLTPDSITPPSPPPSPSQVWPLTNIVFVCQNWYLGLKTAALTSLPREQLESLTPMLKFILMSYGYLDEIGALYGVIWLHPLLIILFTDSIIGMLISYGKTFKKFLLDFGNFIDRFWL